MSQKKMHYAWLIMASCSALLVGINGIACGTIGLFMKPMSQSFNVGIGAVAIFITVQFLTMAVMNPIAGRILTKYNLRVVLSLAAFGAVATMGAMSQFTSIIQLYVAGLFFGVFTTFLMFLTVPILINNWFKKNVATVMGICMAFSGIGGAIFNPIGGIWITMFGWRTAYLLLAVCVAVIVLPFTLFVVRFRPVEKGLKAFGEEENTSVQTSSVELPGISRATAVKTFPFFLLIIFSAMMGLYGGMQPNIIVYAGTLGLSPTVAATTASVIMIGLILGKIILGFLNDKTGPVKAVFIIAVLAVIAISLLINAKSGGVMILLAGSFLFGFCLSLTSIQLPVLVRNVFGQKDYGSIFSIVMMGMSLCSALSSPLYGFIYDINKSYLLAFYLIIGIVVVTFLTAFGAVASGKKLKDNTVNSKSINA